MFQAIIIVVIIIIIIKQKLEIRTGQCKLLTVGVTALWFKSQAGRADDDIFIRDSCSNCNISITYTAYITLHYNYQTPFHSTHYIYKSAHNRNRNK